MRIAPGKRAELTVRAFNTRAFICYEKCGFSAVDTFMKTQVQAASALICSTKFTVLD